LGRTQVPYLGFWLERMTGSWVPMTMVAMGFKLASAGVFVR
jgi:hypothetical protein